MLHDTRRPPVRKGRVSPPRSVPAHIDRPDYVATGRAAAATGAQIQTAETLPRMREACRIAAEVLLEATAAVDVGVTTDEIDAIAHAAFLARDAYPSTLHYGTYTKSVCTSVNEVVCHGIPDDRPLQSGDIVNVDVTAFYAGMHGDTSATVLVGDVDEPTRALVDATREATARGIAAIKPGRTVGAIGAAIEPFARRHGYGVVRRYGGHGIGAVFHAPPHVHHTVERGNTVPLRPGMTLTVEPMLTTAPSAELGEWDDGWTVVSTDGLPSAQFEHTVVVTDTGVEILTVTADGRSAH